jgi:glycine dehydrogenase subunit 1
MQLSERLESLTARNTTVSNTTSFLGAGAYDAYIPAAVDALASRQEFFTAYTPYQPEISQGTLQALFEYQTEMCSLTGLDVSNASVYDAASAVTEAVRMAITQTRAHRVLIAGGLHPGVLRAVRPVLEAVGAQLTVLPLTGLRTGPDAAAAALDAEPAGTFAAVVVQSPNFLGAVEEVAGFARAAAARGALTIQCVMDALSLAVLRSPGSAGADIAAGSGQGFGSGLSFGGPSFGFLTAREKLLRRLPGRIVGESVDVDGRRAYVLTLQAREQHIRREKATSNICSNHSLYALRAAMYLALVGPAGLRAIAESAMRGARELERGLLSTGLFSRVEEAPFFREFALHCALPPALFHRQMRARGFQPGYDLSGLAPEDCPGAPRDAVLFCVTEKTTGEEIRRFVEAVASVSASRADGGVR